MLQELSIKNFAVIEDLNICFSDGLTILSGETGVGKSVIINAVNLLLGDRANASLIRTGCEYAEIKGLFNVEPNAADRMKQYGYNFDQGLLVKRIISKNGKHKIYINKRLSTIKKLISFTENLASIAGQHAHQKLLNEEYHLFILDQYAGLLPLRRKVYELYHQIVPLVKKIKELEKIKSNKDQQIALLKFQKKEIKDADLTLGEEELLEQQRAVLKNSQLLYNVINESVQELYSSQGAIVERLVEVEKKLEKLSDIDPKLLKQANEIADAGFRVEDTSQSLLSYMNSLEMDEKLIDEVEQRIDYIKKLKRKYGRSIDKILSFYENIDKELQELDNLSYDIEKIKIDLNGIYLKLCNAVNDLSNKRQKAAKVLSKKIEDELHDLEMPYTIFKIFIEPVVSDGIIKDSYFHVDDKIISETGIDRSVFMMSPNPGEELKALSYIASGGELSRVVLALKAILAKTESMATIIFDEVDSGIGGGVAEVVGKKISFLSNFHQIICITHLGQIAKFGKYHFKISKNISNGRTNTTIDLLNEKERIKEIARMIGGVEITKATIEHASELLRNVE